MFLLPAIVTAAVVFAQASDGEDPFGPVDVDARMGTGVVLRNESEGFELALRGRFHVLSAWSETDTGITANPLPDVSIRRARLLLSGRVAHDFRFYVHLGFAAQDLEPGVSSPLRDAYATWTRLRDLNVRVGQWKVPFDRQRVTSSSSLQLVDRSIVIRELTLDRDVGLSLMSDDFLGLDHLLAYRVGVFGGEGRNRTSQTPGLLYTARLEVLPLGAFDAIQESDLEHTSRPRVAFGTAYAYSGGTRRTHATTGEFFTDSRIRYHHATADAHFKWKGFSLLGAWLWRRGERPVVDATTPTGVPEHSRSGWGGFGQAGYFVARPVELVARYSELRPMRSDRSTLAIQREVGGGANWFIRGREVNLQADYFYLFRDRLAEGDHQVRVQTQMYF